MPKKGEFVGDSPTREEAARKYEAIGNDFEARYPMDRHYRGGPGPYDVRSPRAALEAPAAAAASVKPNHVRAYVDKIDVPLERKGDARKEINKVLGLPEDPVLAAPYEQAPLPIETVSGAGYGEVDYPGVGARVAVAKAGFQALERGWPTLLAKIF